jgi:histone H3/H4
MTAESDTDSVASSENETNILDEVLEEEPVAAEDMVNENNTEEIGARPRQRAPPCPLDLPFAVVRRLMKAATPQKRFTPELIAAFARGGGAFGLYLLSACQEAAESSGKSTIRPVDVVNGLNACGFPELAEEIRVSMNILVVVSKKKSKRGNVRKTN